MKRAERVDVAPGYKDDEPAHSDLDPSIETAVGGWWWVSYGASCDAGGDAVEDIACCAAELERGAAVRGSFGSMLAFLVFFVGLVVFLRGDAFERGDVIAVVSSWGFGV